MASPPLSIPAVLPAPLHRYNAKLPASYRYALHAERTLNLRALRVLAAHITRPDPPPLYSTPTAGPVLDAAAPASDVDMPPLIGENGNDDNPLSQTAESYSLPVERDLAAFQKGLTRFLDLKHYLPPADYPLFVQVLLSGALTYPVDMGLRGKLALSASHLLSKRDCVLPAGVPWRPIRDMIVRVHLDCVDGGPFIGKDVRDAHCRSMLALLRKARNYLPPDDSVYAIWKEHGAPINPAFPDTAFVNLLILAHVLPTRGSTGLAWLPDALAAFPTMANSPDWDASWLNLFSRVAKHQPGAFNWAPHLPAFYARVVASFKLPLGAAAPQSPVERRCPHHCVFLLCDRTVTAAATIAVYSQSPRSPAARDHLRRLVALIANYFHPSNGGRWTTALGSFLHHLTSTLVYRVTAERSATAAGVMANVEGSPHEVAIAGAEDRLDAFTVDELVSLLLPLVEHGLHSKSGSMTIQAATASRDLAILSPHLVVEPLLAIAAECLESVSSPHRTSAALKMLAALTPVFLDPELSPTGAAALPQALNLTLPGIDPNDPVKTESTLRFIAGATARVQSILASGDPDGPAAEIANFMEDYTHQLLERIFPLLDSLEAPPKKAGYGSVPSQSAPQLSSFIFSVSMNNLFTSMPAPVALAAAERVARHVSGSASLNALKFYGALVRSAAAASAAASPTDGSSGELFIPRLLDQLAVKNEGGELELASLSEDELVWRLRMLAQVSRMCGSSGLLKYADRLADIILLSMARFERRVYKAGGRLLRGMLEGLTAARTVLDVGSNSFGGGDATHVDGDADDFVSHEVEWILPTPESWRAAESLASRFLDEAERVVRSNGVISTDRDVLFRVLRMLHSTQRASRWIMAGVTPKHFEHLHKYALPDDVSRIHANLVMSKADASLALRMPVVAGLGGERDGPEASIIATELWCRAYQLTSEIIASVMVSRPDDGALLYRCLEPLELAHEPFRRNNQGRLTAHACRGYKAAYMPVIATKRPYGADGGAGRAMPRFIFKLRIEAQHEMRLSVAARPGINAVALFNKIMRQTTELSVNAFPRVRGEARGVLTRAWRVAHPLSRRREILYVIDVLEDAVDATAASHEVVSVSLSNVSVGDTDRIDATNTAAMDGVAVADRPSSSAPPKGKDAQYEIMIGASAVLRSAAAAPLLMRELDLFENVSRVLLRAVVVAERPDAGAAVGSLFAKLAGLARPLAVQSFYLVGADLMPSSMRPISDSSEKAAGAKLAKFNGLSLHLLGMLSKPIANGRGDGEMIKDGEASNNTQREIVATDQGKQAHWRLQSLVATVLTICLREDTLPPKEIASFFAESMVSDVVSLRHIASRAIALILALHGRKPASGFEEDGKTRRAVSSFSVDTNVALNAIKDVLTGEGFAKKLIHTLALDHDDAQGADGGSGGQASRSFGVLNFSRYVDGDACWSMINGHPWPMSWVPRSRDNFNIVQVRLYESFCRVYGNAAFSLLAPTVTELITAIDAKQENIIEGVSNENVRIIAGEVVAGMARGLAFGSNGVDQELSAKVFGWTELLLAGFSGPQGAVNGGSLIRLIVSASPRTVGCAVTNQIVDSMISVKPMIVAMDKGAAAHVLGRRLRYVHACVADLGPTDTDVAPQIVSAVLNELTGEVAFGHELKNVREEVSRLLSMLTSFTACAAEYDTGVKTVAIRQGAPKDTPSLSASQDGIEQEDSVARQAADAARKFKSRQGETLSRWTSVVYWNGDALSFSKSLPVLLPAIVASLDEESDQDRVSHARLALSLAAQGAIDFSVILDVVKMCEVISLSPRYRVRGALLPFLQVLSFSLLFTGSDEVLNLIRTIVTNLLSDSQLEVREAAAATFVPIIRDTSAGAIAVVREEFVSVLRNTSVRIRRGQKVVILPENMCKRHGAILGLGSMVSASPYCVPEWMPSVLVTLTGCINDPAPLSTSTRKIFGDFMRTHRDEWQVHKQAFSTEELELVSEQLVSPSYYA
jgi:Proteasome-substrate-size regulator, mid region/Domain of unknown function (DUF3437)